MNIDPESAILSLSEVARTEKRTRDAFYYAGSSIYLILWGVLTLGAGLVVQFGAGAAEMVYTVKQLAGLAISLAIGYSQRARGHHNEDGLKILWALVVLAGFGFLWDRVFGMNTLPGPDRCAIISSFYMMGFVLAGIWVGRVFLYLGTAVTAVIVAGFLWGGDWYNLWLAAGTGGGLILGGFWVRRIGVGK